MSHEDSKETWTELEFNEMSWHDNHVHGMSLSEGEHGSGTVTFDIDYIVEWIKQESGDIGFRIAPASLIFHEVTNLEIHVDYSKLSAALVPFSLDSITRTEEKRARYTATVWKLKLNWPEGFISFEASGYLQVLRMDPIVTTQQLLNKEERGDA